MGNRRWAGASTPLLQVLIKTVEGTVSSDRRVEFRRAWSWKFSQHVYWLCECEKFPDTESKKNMFFFPTENPDGYRATVSFKIIFK